MERGAFVEIGRGYFRQWGYVAGDVKREGNNTGVTPKNKSYKNISRRPRQLLRASVDMCNAR